MCLTAGRCISYSSNDTENTHCYEELAECEQLALDRVALRKALELLLPAEKKHILDLKVREVHKSAQ